MTTREKLITAAAIFLLLLVVFFAYEKKTSDLALAKSESEKVAQVQVIESNAKVIEASRQDQVHTAAVLDAALATINHQRTIIVTPQQAAQALPSIVPNLPTPVQIQNVPATPTAPATQNLIIPQADIPAFQAYKLNCDESNARLLACVKDKEDLQTQLTATAAQFHAEELSAASWEATAKGGTFWHRFGEGIKHSGCGMAGGGAGVKTAQSSTPMNGVIAGVSVTGGCELTMWLIERIKK